MSMLGIAVVKETAPGERRVALDPDGVKRLVAAGVEVLVQSGCGQGAWFSDADYTEAGARVVDEKGLFEEADVVLSLSPPSSQAMESLREGQSFVGLLAPLTNPDLMERLAQRGVTAVSLDGLPRTLSRAQTMDALSSQANVAGYRAVLLAAERFDSFFPLLITAAGTSKPASVLVLGAGVAGLQAIGTARRLGAVVSAYDVRPASKEEVRSLGAKFVDLQSGIAAVGEGGYARELTGEERDAQQAELAAHIAKQSIVITTAQVPGRKPPVLVTADALSKMQAGSVVVDMAASPLGGNVEGSVPDDVVISENGVTIIGAANLPASMPTSASRAYSRNIGALVQQFIADGQFVIDLTDEIQQGVVITHGGKVVHAATAALIGDAS